jgi:predicted ABC-type sugar transport system permease subunit
MSTINITYTAVPGFAATESVASIEVQVIGTVVANNQTLSATPGQAAVAITFAASDTYTITVQGVDASGNLLGTAATTSYTAPAPVTVTLNLPSSVTVTP